MSCNLTPFVILLLYTFTLSTSQIQDCPNEWFGSNCQYKCHCDSPLNCDRITGQCLNTSKCARGWFGSACQYQDLKSDPSATITTVPPQTSYDWITDVNDATCNTDVRLSLVNVSWTTTLPFTWMRMTLNDSAYLGRLTVSLTRSSTPHAVYCSEQKIYVINKNTIDIRCNVIVDTTSVIIEGHGVKSVCSLYVSGGRNVALKQTASQTSTYGKAFADNAVDGKTSGLFSDNTCTHTDDSNDFNPSWTVTFEHHQLLNRILLYNRNENVCTPSECGLRLKKFILKIFNSTNTVLEYQDQSDNFSSIYSVPVPEKESIIPVIGLDISFSFSNNAKILTLCEVEAYGDCVPGSWGLKCDPCSPLCNSSCDVENGACQICNGAMNPPACDTQCNPGSWGLNCNTTCQLGCFNSSCDRLNGSCNKGCNGYSNPPQCTEKCDKGKWGRDCFNTCNTSCWNHSCSSVSGMCNEGCNGYKNFPNCTIACDNGAYGVNCSQNCNNCWGSSCNSSTGLCINACNGSLNFPTCNAVCYKDRWGKDCSNACNTSCWDKSCNRFNGMCDVGCNGYKDFPKCSKVCDNGRWGQNCSKTCNASCWDNSCNHVNGVCDQGCNGYNDFPNCTKECDPGVSGLNCTNHCDNCYNKSCSSQTGFCDIGCDGYSNPPSCNISCCHGQWGLNCTQSCHENCFNTSCDKQNGRCDKGCDGYNDPPYCNKICTPDLWGINCSKICSENCWDRSCDHKRGQCNKGCNGYKNPPHCNEGCDSVTWSINCTASCSSQCFNTSCHSQTGECHQGCHAGYVPPNCERGCDLGFYGINCSNHCSSNCSKSQCQPILGHCLKCNDEHTGHFCEALIDAATPIGVIVGPIIAAIVVSVLILAGVVLWRRRRAFKRAKNNDGDVDDTNESTRISNTYQKILSVFQKKPKDTYNEDDTDSINPQGLYNNEGTYANLQNTSIAVEDLYSYMHSHNKDYFEEQFKNIPVPKNVTTEVGMSSLNKHKNRYKNICTYDHSRVHLEINTARNEGDYINASYIKGLKKHDQFIASQGPNNIVLNDFVRMLWEQQVDKVVMLTNLIEEGTVKCEKYWPDEATKQFGEIHIKLSSTQTFSDYIIRVLELSKPNEPSRILTQFHFTSWPDKGVPSAPWGLVDFEQRVSAKPTSRPIVVHCSAGVGRTGTFIALSNVLKEAEETGRIDCFQTVMRLRQDRVLMIQTAEQYWFLHRAAQVAIVCIGTTVTSNDIVGRIKLLDERTTTGKTKLEEEFKAVCDVCNEFVEEPQEVEDSTVEDANVYNNIEEMTDRSKNRFINILPKQKYRPFLACENQNMGDYINAVFLPGFKKKDQQLLTQLPMPKTVLDFWRMIKQYRISLIVAFELDAIANDETFGQYLPAGVEKTLNCSPYIVKMNDIKSSSLCEEQKLTVEMEKQKSLLSLSSTDQASQTVMHLKCLFTDFEPVKLLRFIKQVRSYNELADGRILYTCRNGAKYSGLASVLSLLLDRMEHDSCLTVPLVVGTIKTIRPEVISTVDQYRVLYQVLQRYSDNSVQYESLWSVAGNGAILSTTKNPAFDETQDTDANIYANV
ncbi:unnamed protein product [Lymnaea stagnalis]|uniref:protein-tyrosine-phosphatase n=1 Tax=Lymnaea stagnalis TaxID=6523 RepID=A0AAV2HJY6_LYMST